MFAKLATVIIVLGAMFGALLVNRQQRIDAAAEISRIHFRMQTQERERTVLQAKVAAMVRPDRLREKVTALAKHGADKSSTNGFHNILLNSGFNSGFKRGFKPIPFRYDPASATNESLGAIDDSMIGNGRDGGLITQTQRDRHQEGFGG